MTESATHVRRVDCLALIGSIDRQHTLRILPNGRLALLADPKSLRGRHQEVTVLATEEPTRRRAVQLALMVRPDSSKLPQGLLKAIRTKLGTTASESLDIAAAFVATDT